MDNYFLPICLLGWGGTGDGVLFFFWSRHAYVHRFPLRLTATDCNSRFGMFFVFLKNVITAFRLPDWRDINVSRWFFSVRIEIATKGDLAWFLILITLWPTLRLMKLERTWNSTVLKGVTADNNYVNCRRFSALVGWRVIRMLNSWFDEVW